VAEQRVAMSKAPIKFVRFKDAFTRREVLINADRVQLLEDAT
jgi:hypothetical protein